MSALADAVGAALGRAVTAERSVGGGSINDAHALDFADGTRAFVKTRAGAAAGEQQAGGGRSGARAGQRRWLVVSHGTSAIRATALINYVSTFCTVT